MAYELDHLFVCTSFGAPEADRLVEFGLTEGSSNTHPGQGTANRRFFFHNSMIELLWLADEQASRCEAATPLGFYKRCRYQESGASPFGFCVKPARTLAVCGNNVGPTDVDETAHSDFPFRSWRYRAPFIPEEVSMYIGANSDRPDEPLLIYSPQSRRPDLLPPERKQPIEHAAGVREISSVLLNMPNAERASDELSALAQMDWISIKSGDAHVVEISFDGAREGRRFDFRPELPLVFRS